MSMPDKGYKLIKRSSTPKTGDCSIDFGNRRYNTPLCGCSNYDGVLEVGDIVGIKMSSNTCLSTTFSSSSLLLSSEQVLALMPPHYGHYRPVEEHLFKITKVRKPSKYDVVPYFIDGNKVISKEINESYSSNWDVPVSAVDKFTLCNELFCEKRIHGNITIDEKYDCFSSYRAKKLEGILESVIDEGQLEPSIVKSIRGSLPFKGNWTKTMFDLRTDRDTISHFYDVVIKYMHILTTCLDESQISDIGSFDKIEEHMDSIYAQALVCIGAQTVRENGVNHQFQQSSQLSVPIIVHTIDRIKYNDIFRVYKSDPRYCLHRAKYTSSWCGVIVDDSIRNHFEPGNIVRLIFGENPSAVEETAAIIATNVTTTTTTTTKSYQFCNVIYCRLLKRVDNERFLACIENMYCSEYEDIVLVVHTAAVSEIPFDFSGNENLVATGLNCSSGQGFGVTGLGAAVMDSDTGLGVTGLGAAVMDGDTGLGVTGLGAAGLGAAVMDGDTVGQTEQQPTTGSDCFPLEAANEETSTSCLSPAPLIEQQVAVDNCADGQQQVVETKFIQRSYPLTYDGLFV